MSVTIQFTNYLHNFLAFYHLKTLPVAFFLAWALVRLILPLQLYASLWSRHSSLINEVTSINMDVYSRATIILPSL